MATRPSRKTPERARKAQPTAQSATNSGSKTPRRAVLSEEERRRMVAEAAYYRAQQRGFGAGGEIDDWLAAERDIARQFQAR